MIALKLHHARMRACLRQRRIHRLRLADQIGLLHVAADADPLRSGRPSLLPGGGGGGGGAARAPTDDAAEDAARSSTGNAARNAAHYTGRRQTEAAIPLP